MLLKLGSPATSNLTSCGRSTTFSVLNKISSSGSAFKTEHEKTMRRSSFFKPLATDMGKRCFSQRTRPLMHEVGLKASSVLQNWHW
ncbi:hypothetical protein HanPI659440_Chr14g0525321 [Helianthus annuus]|nr:hypothetical protein HanPI659440_Chr14g0525321 [Helianthus annuus]